MTDPAADKPQPPKETPKKDKKKKKKKPAPMLGVVFPNFNKN